MRDVVNLLIEKKMTIATMESCTGGFVVSSITDIDGSSNVLKFSAVTYSNEYKIRMGVPEEIIDKYSVYSFEVSDSMALNISNFSHSDLGVGITGKLNRVDKNNPFGEDNVVFISIFDKREDKYYREKIEAVCESRSKNKDLVIAKICEMIREIIK